MRNVLIPCIAAILGLIAGWVLHRSETEDRIRRFVERTGLSEAELADAARDAPKVWKKMEVLDFMAAAVAGSALRQIHDGKVDDAKISLARCVASYASLHASKTNSAANLSDDRKAFLETIENLRSRIPELDRAMQDARKAMDR